MVKVKTIKPKKLDRLVICLFVAALLIEIANTFISIKLGTIAANQCPRTTDQQTTSMLISLVSIMAIVGAIIKSRGTLTTLYGIFFIFLIMCWGTLLWLIASGGLNWCNFQG